MEGTGTLVLSVGLIIFLAHFFSSIFEKTKMPDVLPLIFIGILFSLLGYKPEVFGLSGSILSSIALALMLFQGGSHLSFDILKKGIKKCLLLSFVTFFCTLCLAFLFFHYVIGTGMIASVYGASIISCISPAVLVPIVYSLKINERLQSISVLESAITDVISIILAIGILEVAKAGGISVVKFIGTNLISIVFISFVVGFVGAIIWSILLEKIRKFPNSLTSTLAFIFILYGICELFGFNGPFAVLVFGLALSNSSKIPVGIIKRFGASRMSEFTAIEKKLFSEIIFLVKTFFFVYLGISIEFSHFPLLVSGLILTLIIFFIRLVIVKPIMSRSESIRDLGLLAFIIPRGLATAVLAQIPLHMNLAPSLEYDFLSVLPVVNGVVLSSIILTAVLIFLHENGKTNTYLNNFFKKS